MTKMPQYCCTARLIWLASLLLCFTNATQYREYFVAIEEIEWDYAPLSTESIRPIFLAQGPDRIGKVYKKAVYREYTDETFRTQSYRHPSLGLYGPVLKAEVKSTITVHALNRASRKYSLHPHGVFYSKSSEGALYTDNTTNTDKEDDGIPPGGTHTYIWEVRDEYGPAPEDPNCLTWAYHSHVDPNKDVHSGLIGTILTCRRGTLTSNGFRTDVDREFSVIVAIVDENQSWYIDENIQKYTSEPSTVNKKDNKFTESNTWYAINGRSQFNLPGLTMCQGDLISWHMIAMGSEVHTMAFLGQTFTLDSHRMSTVALFPATFKTIMMSADNPGKWTLACQVTTHQKNGMSVDLEIVDQCRRIYGSSKVKRTGSLDGSVRTFFVAIEEVEWDYAPSGMHLLANLSIDFEGLDSATYFAKGPTRIGGVYKKAVFRGYTSDSFEEKAPREPYMGILGPLIYGEVGDTIRVVLKNNGTKEFRIEPGGVFFSSRENTRPGEVKTYIWTIPQSVSPTTKDEDCLTYLYASTASVEKDQESGLVGPILVCKRGMLEKELQKRNFYIVMNTFDENLSHYLQENIAKYTTDPGSVDKNDPAFIKSNKMAGVNGFSYLNTPTIDLCVGQDNFLRAFSIGTEIDNHSFLAEGAITRSRTEYTGVLGLHPHIAVTLNASPYAPGLNEYGCYVMNHGVGAMVAPYTSSYCNDEVDEWQPTGEKTFYIGIVEEIWDYFPERIDHKGDSVDDPEHYAYLESKQEDGKFIGTKYKKAIYYEYTDETFTVRKPKPEHLGLLGPIIKLETGDKVNVTLYNNATIPYAIQPIGIYVVGSQTIDEVPAVEPGEEFTYTWEVRPEVGPAEGQPDCLSHSYTSFASFIDGYSGLYGTVLICRRGTLNQGKGGMADEDFHLLFSVFDENLSHYLDDNIRDFAKADPETFNKSDPDFIQSNKMSHINGRMYHLPGLNMNKGDKVRWHVTALGEEDIHSAHFHANAFTHQSDKENRGDVFDLVQRQDATVIMYPDAVGEWLLHCHSNKHATTGMVTTYNVMEAKAVCKYTCEYNCEWDKRVDCSLLGIEKFNDFINGRREIRVRKDSEVMLLPADQITYLDLSNNIIHSDIETLKFLLASFPLLHTLILDNIGLSELPADLFKHNNLLRVVRLKGNNIKVLVPEFVKPETNIAVLDLRWNDIVEVPRFIYIGGRNGLRMLDLYGNFELNPSCLNALHRFQEKIVRCLEGY